MGRRKEYIGTVIGDTMQKTCIVRIMQMVKHKKYGRSIKKYIKFKVHDERKEAKVNDMVRIQETRPISKEKRFRLIEIIKKAHQVHAHIEEETT